MLSISFENSKVTLSQTAAELRHAYGVQIFFVRVGFDFAGTPPIILLSGSLTHGGYYVNGVTLDDAF